MAGLTFSSPEYLFLLIVPLAIFIYAVLIKKAHWLSSLLRNLAVALLILALASPELVKSEKTKSLSALVDVSGSISIEGKRALLESLSPYLEEEGSKLKIFPFAKNLAAESYEIGSTSELDDLINTLSNADDLVDTGKTNIGNSIYQAANSVSSQSLLLLSDGQQNLGDLDSSLQRIAAKGIQVYPIIPEGEAFEAERLEISNLRAPLKARAGAKIEIAASIANSFTENKSARVEIWLDDEKLSSEKIETTPEQERLLTLDSPNLKGGLKRIKTLLFDKDKLIDERHRWISVEEPEKLLLLSGSTDDNKVINQLLTLKGYSVESIIANGRKDVSTNFKPYSLVILNNVSKKQLPKNFLGNIEDHVHKKGGGLLIIGGPKSFGLGGYKNTKLEVMSPVKFSPPRTSKRRLISAVALVIDKSRSMRVDNRIVSAKQAAITAIDALKDDDFVSVIGFDSAPFVIIRMDKVKEVKPIAQRRLRNLTPAGRTNLLPALAAARQALVRSGAGRRHIIVLSDGKVPDAGSQYFNEINRLRKEGITVSSVALGGDADVPFLKVVAEKGSGAFYHTTDPSKLPQIFLRDIKVSVGEETMKEDDKFLVFEGRDGLYSTSLRSFPHLLGFVETQSKKGARIELITKKKNQSFPILASWKYGLGQVVTFTSDANGRWSTPWLKWKNFVRFWSEIIETSKPKDGEKGKSTEFDLRYKIESEKLVLDLSIFDKSLAGRSAPTITAKITKPGGGKKEVIFKQKTRGKFMSEIADVRPGDYKIELKYGSLKLPVMGLTLNAKAFGERIGEGLNVGNLGKIALSTKGEINPLASAVSSEKRVLSKRNQLFIPLVIISFFLIILEALLREIYISDTSTRLK